MNQLSTELNLIYSGLEKWEASKLSYDYTTHESDNPYKSISDMLRFRISHFEEKSLDFLSFRSRI